MSARARKSDFEYVRDVLIDTAHEAMFQSDNDGIIRWANHRCATMLGYDGPSELIGRQARDLYLTPRVRDRMVRQLQAKGRVVNLTAQLKRRDGRRCVMEMNASLLRSPDGEVCGIVGIGRDVTRRMVAQKAKRRRYEFSQRVLDTIPACVFAVDLSGRITWLNGAACRMCGEPPSLLVGRNVFTDAPEWMRQRADDIRAVMTEGQIRSVRRAHVTCRGDASHYVNFTIVPVRDLGEISGAVVEATDVTETVELYMQMLQAERRFRALFDSAPEVYLSFDSDGTVVDCNETTCEVLGHARDEVIGRPLADMYMPDDRDQALRALADGPDASSQPVEVRLESHAGRPIRCELTVRSLHDESGQTLASFAVHRLARRRRRRAASR